MADVPAKSGASHAVAAFLSILLGGLISDVLGTYASVFSDFSQSLGEPIVGVLGGSISATTTGHLLIATGLAFAWGVAYHYARHGSTRDEPAPRVEGPTANPAADDLPDPDGGDVPEALAGIVTGGYAPESVGAADGEVQSYLETTLGGDVRSRLARTHDRLVDAEQRSLAERVASLESDIETLQRSLSPALAATVADPDRRDALRASHVDLVEATAALRASADTLESAAQDGRPDSAIAECRGRYEALRNAHQRRRRLIEQASDTP